MSTEKDQLNVLFEQTQSNFMPPVSIQIDISQMQSIFQGMCKQMIRMQSEIDGLKSQLNSKTNQNDFLNFTSQFNNKIENVLENNNESISQINSNMESLKNALIAGLEKCESDALNVARDLVSEVKPITAQTESRKSSSQRPRSSESNLQQSISNDQKMCSSFTQTVPDLEELAMQLQDLSERVKQIETNHNTLSDDLNEKLTERLAQLENGNADQSVKLNQTNDSVPDEVYQVLREHSDQIKKLTEELSIAKTTHSTPAASQVELPPDDREAITQLNDRLIELENNVASFNRTTNDLSGQIKDQTAQLSEYKNLLEKGKSKTASNLPDMESIKELINSEIKRSKEEENNEGLNDNGIEDSDEEADESDNSMDTPRRNRLTDPTNNENAREIQKPAPVINTDELLESFLDATRAEVDKARKSIMDEISSNLRNTTSQLSGSISKVQATFDIELKKVNSNMTEQLNQVQSDLKNSTFEQQNAIKDLHVSDANILEKIRLIEQRLDSVMKVANSPPPKMEAIIDKKGKLDLAPLLQQIQAQSTQLEDLTNRMLSLEHKEYVSPASFNGLFDMVSLHDGKLSQLDAKTGEITTQLNEIKETTDELKNKINSPEAQMKEQELLDKASSLDEETKRLCEAMVKFNKDLISMRAAINTLRSHSEETSGSVEDLIKMCEKAREEAAATDKKVKKIVSFVQGETTEMSNQIKDISASVERNADRIEEIANRMIETPKTVTSSKEEEEEEEDYDENDRNTPKSRKQKKKPNDKEDSNSNSNSPAKTEVKYENIMTSPHIVLPPLEEKKETQEELIIPKLSPHSNQKNHEQPIVPIVKKNIDAEQISRLSNKAPLPRLAKVPGQQVRSQSEITKNDLRKYDDLFGRLDQLEQKFNKMKSAIDGINKQTKQLQDSKAEKDALQALFDQFRLAMGELNNRIGSLRKNIIQKADIAELIQVRTDILREIKIQGETAAGTEPVRCLLCGNPRHNIAGAFDQAALASLNASSNANANTNSNINPMSIKQTGLNSLSVSSRVSGADGSVCYVYGNNGQMYLGRSQDGKPVVLKNLMNDPGNEGNGEPIQGTVPLPGVQ